MDAHSEGDARKSAFAAAAKGGRARSVGTETRMDAASACMGVGRKNRQDGHR